MVKSAYEDYQDNNDDVKVVSLLDDEETIQAKDIRTWRHSTVKSQNVLTQPQSIGSSQLKTKLINNLTVAHPPFRE